MTKTTSNLREKQWNCFGYRASVSSKNALLGEIITSPLSRETSAAVDRWLAVETYRGFALPGIITKLLGIDPEVVVYCTYSEREDVPERLLVTSTSFEETIFDKIIDCVVDYERTFGRRLVYYYAAGKNVREFPKDAIIYRNSGC